MRVGYWGGTQRQPIALPRRRGRVVIKRDRWTQPLGPVAPLDVRGVRESLALLISRFHGYRRTHRRWPPAYHQHNEPWAGDQERPIEDRPPEVARDRPLQGRLLKSGRKTPYAVAPLVGAQPCAADS